MYEQWKDREEEKRRQLASNPNQQVVSSFSLREDELGLDDLFGDNRGDDD